MLAVGRAVVGEWIVTDDGGTEVSKNRVTLPWAVHSHNVPCRPLLVIRSLRLHYYLVLDA